MYKHIAEWRKFLRRHECNVFDALFYDKEDITEEDVKSIVTKVAAFHPSIWSNNVKNDC